MTETNPLFTRTEMLFGHEAMERLAAAHVAVFGVGGVGGYAIEALARCGVGQITIVDHDTVSESNRNRQIIATSETVGQSKTAVMAARLKTVNPALCVTERDCFFDASNAHTFDFSAYDYVLDAIDTVSSKLLLIEKCMEAGVPLLASMGTGNKTDPTRLRVDNIDKTSVCPLARTMRLECKKRGIRRYSVVWSDEVPMTPVSRTEEPLPQGKRATPGSTAFVPPAAGLLMARTCVMALIGSK